MRRIFVLVYVSVLSACESDPSVGNLNDLNVNDVADTHIVNEIEEVSEDVTVDAPDIAEIAQEDLLAIPDECTKENEQTTCNDEVACTDDLCMNGVCQNLADALHCDDGNACTIDTCEKGVVVNGGCHQKDRPCEDGNPCTLDACNVAIGCDYTKLDPMACAGLGDECTTAICVADQGCALVAQNCDDGDINTIDVCAKDIGCVNTIVACGNGFSECVPSSPCVTANCKSGVCVEKIKVCDDDINCTKDLCDNNGLCQHVPIHELCPISDSICVQLVCDLNFGCTTLGVLCDDGNVCTTDVCVDGQGCAAQKIPGCCLDSDDCQDGNSCTQDNCGVDNHCSFVATLCDDGLECTIDVCIPSGSTSYCTFNPNCDDKNLCTYDFCNYLTGECEHKLETCWEGHLCDPASGKCLLKEGSCESWLDCDDGNMCTQDVCENFECTNNSYDYPVWCEGANVCESGTCWEGECVIKIDTLCIACEVNEDCPSNIVCDGLKKSIEYLGSCDNQGRCEYSTQICSSNPCENSQCIEGSGCHYESKCSDGDPCTVNPCNWNTGECMNSFATCDDGDVCTIDVCSPQDESQKLSCSFDKKIDCDDEDAATFDWCHYQEGCKHTIE